MPGTTYDYTSFYPYSDISSPQTETSAADSPVYTIDGFIVAEQGNVLLICKKEDSY